MWTSILSPTASKIAGSALIELSAPSSWRPPWLDTIMASAPTFSAIFASSASKMPLRITLPPHSSLICLILSQSNDGSNCCAVQSIRLAGSETSSTCPTIFPKKRRLVFNMSKPHPHLVDRLSIFFNVGLGGADRPFFKSL